MIIQSNNLDNLRPVHQESSEIQKRYKQIKIILKEEAELFAKPEYISEKEIVWHTELNGEVIQYTKASDEIKEVIIIQLKKQINNIFNNEAIKNDEELLKYIELIIEIPNLDSIYYINNRVVIVNWGYIEDTYNAERNIIKKLIDGVLFRIYVEDEDGRAVPDLQINIKYGLENKEYKTNENGEIVLDVIYGTNVNIDIDLKNNPIYKGNNIQKTVQCLRENTESTIVLDFSAPVEPTWFEKNKKKLLAILISLLILAGIIFLLLNLKKDISINVYDKDTKKPLSQAIVYLSYTNKNNKIESTKTTNKNGQVVFTKIPFFQNKIVIDVTKDLYLENKKHYSDKFKTTYDIYLKKLGFNVALKTKGKNKIYKNNEILEENAPYESTKTAYQYNLNKPAQLTMLHLIEYDGDYDGNNFIRILLIDENSNVITLKKLIPSGNDIAKIHVIDLSKYKMKVKTIVVEPIDNKDNFSDLGGSWQIQKLSVDEILK